MEKRIMKYSMIADFEKNLINMEKSDATVEKYVRDVKAFYNYLLDRPDREVGNGTEFETDSVIESEKESGKEHESEAKAGTGTESETNFEKNPGAIVVTKEKLMLYKAELGERGYMATSINSMIVSINRFLSFAGWEDFRVKELRIQRKIFQDDDKILDIDEYRRLVRAAGADTESGLILQTICSTGIRVSELRFFTAEAVEKGEVEVNCKNKRRIVLIPEEMIKKLKKYLKEKGITEGVIFRTSKGKPIDRSRIWDIMKKLCKQANVKESKVFPHNLRKLFARCFYNKDRDIARLADILGHLNINTTRIYIMTTLKKQIKTINSLGLILGERKKFGKQKGLKKRIA